MKIHTLELRNFRKFEDYTFRFHPQFTVLIGDNASGKSSILDALSVMLGSYLLRFQEVVGRTGIRKEESRLKIFEKYDQITHERQKPTFLNAHGTLHGKDIEWTRKLGDRGKDARNLILTLTPNGWGIAHCEKQKFEVNSTFEAVTAGFYDTNIFPILGIRNRRRYLPYPVFDRQKVRYYGVFDETCPLSNTELRF